MFPTQEQFANAAKANLEAQLSILSLLSNKAFESVEKVVDLNLNAARATLEDSAVAAKQLLAAKDAPEFVSLTAAQAQPSAAKAIAYGRQLAGIATSAQAEITRVTEEQLAEAGRKVSSLVDDFSRNAPAGSENFLAVWKSAFGNASAGYEQFSKSVKQASEVVEANVNNAVSQFSQAAEQAVASARRK